MMQAGGMGGGMNGDGGNGGMNPQNDAFQSIKALQDPPQGDWRDEMYRNKVRQQIDEQLRNVGQLENGQKSVEWENQVFQRSKNKDEYIKLVATLILKLRDYNKKNSGQQPGPRPGQAMNQQSNPNQQPMPQPGNMTTPQGMPNTQMNQLGSNRNAQQPYMANQMRQTSLNQSGQPQISQAQQQTHMNPRHMNPNVRMNNPQAQNYQNPNPGSMPNGMNSQMMSQMSEQNRMRQNVPNQNQMRTAPSPGGAIFVPSPAAGPVPSPGSASGVSNSAQLTNQQISQSPQNQTGQVYQAQVPPSPQNDEYMEKLKTLRKYIEPLTRQIQKKEQEVAANIGNPHVNKMRQDTQKMKSLRDIILGNQYVAMDILNKCEKVLQQIAPVNHPKPDVERMRDEHMCQGLLDAVSAHIRKPNINHTLNRTFGPVLEKIRPEQSVTPKRVCQIEEYKRVQRPRMIPSVLQGEVASLNRKFRARLDKSRSNSAGDVHIIVSINDITLPPVKELKITIPNGYPSIPPLIQNEKYLGNNSKTGMEMAEYDQEEDFLKIQEDFFEERLDSLGPDLVTLTQILSAWELSIRQALAKMNITYAKQRQMMLMAPVVAI